MFPIMLLHLGKGPMQYSGIDVFIFLCMPALFGELTLSQERERLISDHKAESTSPPPLCCTIELCLWRRKRIDSLLEFSPSEVHWRNANSKRYSIATAAEIGGLTLAMCIRRYSLNTRFLNPLGFGRAYKPKKMRFNFACGIFSNRSN